MLAALIRKVLTICNLCNGRRNGFALLGAGLVLLVFVLRPALYRSKLSSIGVTFSEHDRINRTIPRSGIKTVAMGSPVFGRPLERKHPLEITEKGNVCQYVQDYNESDAVLFHGTELLYPNPVNRPPGQVWVILLDESPANAQIFPAMADGLFNFTLGYTRHSDILFSYGQARTLTRAEILARNKDVTGAMDYTAGKTEFGAARISQCQHGLGIVTNRMAYLKELQHYVPMDFFGSCLTGRRCPDEECSNHALGKKYKFFFAFENSMCKDYITEKFWEVSLRHNMVPVVQGGLSRQDYEDLAPPHSFIHVDDFSGPESLAEYLKYLDKNDTAYNEYHKWRATHTVYVADMFKLLCDKLHESTGSHIITALGDVFGHKFCRFPPGFHDAPWHRKLPYFRESYHL